MATIPDRIENKFLAAIKAILNVVGLLSALAVVGAYQSNEWGMFFGSVVIGGGAFWLASKIKAVWHLKRGSAQYE